MKSKPKRRRISDKLLVGWNEWCGLPALGLPAIKAKIDTGARTSALHAFDIKVYKRGANHFVRFNIHPLQGNNDLVVACHAKVIDRRYVMSSNGHRERRVVISSSLHIGEAAWPIEITLSNRDPLTYRMLLGREALSGRAVIDPRLSCRQGKISRDFLRKLYR